MKIGIIAVVVVLAVIVIFWQLFNFYFFVRIARALNVAEGTSDLGILTAELKDIYMRRMLQGLENRQGIFSAGKSKKERLKAQVERLQNDPERIALERTGKRPPLSRFEDVLDGLSNL